MIVFEWIDQLSENNPKLEALVRFCFRDLMSCLCLYFSMRGGLWNLRFGGIKTLAPLFAAFDRPHYQRLIPNHLHDLLHLPTEITSVSVFLRAEHLFAASVVEKCDP